MTPSPTYIYGLFDPNGSCLYVGQSAAPRRRFEGHKRGRFKDVPCTLKVLRECSSLLDGDRLEVQVMRAYRKRGQAAMNRALRASGNYIFAKPDKPVPPDLETLEHADDKTLISGVMAYLGSIKSARKAKSSAENLKKGRYVWPKGKKRKPVVTARNVGLLVLAGWFLGAGFLIHEGEKAARRGVEQVPSLEIVP